MFKFHYQVLLLIFFRRILENTVLLQNYAEAHPLNLNHKANHCITRDAVSWTVMK